VRARPRAAIDHPRSREWRGSDRCSTSRQRDRPRCAGPKRLQPGTIAPRVEHTGQLGLSGASWLRSDADERAADAMLGTAAARRPTGSPRALGAARGPRRQARSDLGRSALLRREQAQNATARTADPR
jgi:hypothetical protein